MNVRVPPPTRPHRRARLRFARRGAPFACVFSDTLAFVPFWWWGSGGGCRFCSSCYECLMQYCFDRFLPLMTSVFSSTNVDKKFMLDSLATSITYCFTRGIANQPLRIANAPDSPDQNCRAGPRNVTILRDLIVFCWTWFCCERPFCCSYCFANLPTAWHNCFFNVNIFCT